MDLTPGQRRATQYWGAILSGTLAGDDTRGIWQRINEQATALGYERAGVTAQDISFLRSHAVNQRNARTAFDRLDPEDRITSAVVASTPWERDLGQQVAAPEYHVQVEWQFMDGQQLKSEWRTIRFRGELPPSRAELEQEMGVDAEQWAEKYGVGHVGFGSYYVERV